MRSLRWILILVAALVILSFIRIDSYAHEVSTRLLQALSAEQPEQKPNPLIELVKDIADLFRANQPIGLISPTQRQNVALISTNKNRILVASVSELLEAIKNAKPGHTIEILPGEYRIAAKSIPILQSGLAEQPILLFAANKKEVTLYLDTIEGLYFDASHWQVKNLTFIGDCQQYSCEHAIHIVGASSSLTFQGNTLINFDAHLKANGLVNQQTQSYVAPSQINIQSNTFYNKSIRTSSNPVTPIDIVGGTQWKIEDNFIADFAKGKGNQIAYGLFVKGQSDSALIQNNLIACRWNLPHSSANDIRVGISLGGGGTLDKFCPQGQCEYEHKDGHIIKNTIVNCPNDVGIYLNNAVNSNVSKNVLNNTLGIQASGSVSTGRIDGNCLDGRVFNTKSAQTISGQNRFIGKSETEDCIGKPL